MAQDLGDIIGSALGGRGNRVLGTILNGTSNVRPSTLLNEEYARQQQDPNDSLTKKEADAILDRAQNLRYPLTITNGPQEGTFVFSYPGAGASPPLRLPMETVDYVQSRRVNWQADVTNHPEVAAARAGQATQSQQPASRTEEKPAASKPSPAVDKQPTPVAAQVSTASNDRYSAMSDQQLWQTYETYIADRVVPLVQESGASLKISVDGNYTQAEYEATVKARNTIFEDTLESIGSTVKLDGKVTAQEIASGRAAVEKMGQEITSLFNETTQLAGKASPEEIADYQKAMKDNAESLAIFDLYVKDLQDRTPLAPTASREELIARLTLMDGDAERAAAEINVPQVKDAKNATPQAPVLTLDTAALIADDRVTGGTSPATQVAAAAPTPGAFDRVASEISQAGQAKTANADARAIEAFLSANPIMGADGKPVTGTRDGFKDDGILSEQEATAALNRAQALKWSPDGKGAEKLAALDAALTQGAKDAPAMAQASAAGVNPDSSSITLPTSNGLLSVGLLGDPIAKDPAVVASPAVSAAPISVDAAPARKPRESITGLQAEIRNEFADGKGAGENEVRVVEQLLAKSFQGTQRMGVEDGKLTDEERGNFQRVINGTLDPKVLAGIRDDLRNAGVADGQQVNAGDPPKGNTVTSGMGASKDTAALLG